MYRLDLTTARCEALFASPLQPSERPGADRVRAAVVAAVRAHGSRGCAGLVAQEFGDHPETASARMRWARSQVAAAFVGAPSAARRPVPRVTLPSPACALPIAAAA